MLPSVPVSRFDGDEDSLKMEDSANFASESVRKEKCQSVAESVTVRATRALDVHIARRGRKKAWRC